MPESTAVEVPSTTPPPEEKTELVETPSATTPPPEEKTDLIEAPSATIPPEEKTEPVAAAASEESPPTTATPVTTTDMVPASESDARPAGDINALAAPVAPDPALDLDGDVTVTKRSGVNGCQGARPTPGSANTKKRLLSGSVGPGEVATFLIEYPVDAKDVGRETFEILDCVFVNDVAVESYDISFVPNEESFQFTYSLTIPAGAPIGALYCNVAKTTAAPSDSQASNRKAGPACFIIGGDLRVLKVKVDGTGLAGATFSVSCTPPDAPAGTTLPPIIIEGVTRNTMPPTVINGDMAISIAGPHGTECVVTEVAAPPGYALPDPNFITVTIGVDGPEIRFVNVLAGSPNLRIVKTADAAIVNAGSQIGFGINVTNVGDAIATAVTLSDPLPAGTGINWSLTSGYHGTCAITGAVGSQTLNCSFGNLAPLASVNVHVTSPTTVGTVGTFRNVATAVATNHPSVNDDATVTVRQPVLTIVKTADAASVNSGSPIGFGITVANNGDGTATAVTLSDPLPSGTGINWSINPAYAGPGTCAITGSGPQTLNCSFGDMAPGATATVHVTSPTTSATSGTFRNVATASATNHGDVSDDATVTVDKPNLSIVKTAADPVVNAGSPIAFTVTVTNAGPGTATAVTLNDPLPPAAGVTWTVGSGHAGCSISGTSPTQVLSCAFGDLASGATAGVQVVSSTTSATSGTLVNTATATAGNHPPVSDDAQVVINRPGLSVAKVADATSVNSGSPIGFTVTVTNAGPGMAADVVLNDPLPSGTGISWSISPARAGCAIAGAVGAQVLACSFGDMAAAATASVHVVSATTAATSGTFTNTATASASNHEPVTAIANVVVNKPNLSVTKTADAPSVTSGSPIGFTVTVSNAGPGAAINVTLSDPLPSGVDVSWSISPATAGCSITGTTAQTLTCTLASLASGASLSVHVVSSTTVNSVGTFNNVATTQAANHPAVSANASTAVVAPPVVAGVIFERAAPAVIAPAVIAPAVIAPAPAPPAPAPAVAVGAAAPATLPRTGSDPLSLMFAGMLLIATGFRFRRWSRRA